MMPVQMRQIHHDPLKRVLSIIQALTDRFGNFIGLRVQIVSPRSFDISLDRRLKRSQLGTAVHQTDFIHVFGLHPLDRHQSPSRDIVLKPSPQHNKA